MHEVEVTLNKTLSQSGWLKWYRSKYDYGFSGDSLLLIFPSGVNVAETVSKLLLFSWRLLTLWQHLIQRNYRVWLAKKINNLKLKQSPVYKCKRLREDWHLYHSPVTWWAPEEAFMNSVWPSSALMPAWNTSFCWWWSELVSPPVCVLGHMHVLPHQSMSAPLCCSCVLTCVDAHLCIVLTAVYLCVSVWLSRLKVNCH